MEFCTSSLVHVQGLGTASAALSPFLLPVVRLSTDLSEQCSVYLLEDGLELWLAVLHNAAEVTQDLLALADNIPPILRECTHLFHTCSSEVQKNHIPLKFQSTTLSYTKTIVIVDLILFELSYDELCVSRSFFPMGTKAPY